MSFHTYMLRCADGSYYVGHTDDLDARLAQHQRGEIPGYTQERRPVTLVWSEIFPTRDEAFAAERRIKGWSRAKKEALIEGDWSRLSQLAKKPALRYAGSTSSPATQDEREGEGQNPSPLILSSDRAKPRARIEGPEDEPKEEGQNPSPLIPSSDRAKTRAPIEGPEDERKGEDQNPSPLILSSDRAKPRARIEGPEDERERTTHPAHPEEGLSTPSVSKTHHEGPAIVLVRPQLGENIGKAARAMLNFGLTDLRLVRPRDGWPNPSAGPAASGADIVLEKARVFDSVAEAVADCPFVYATTVRKRGLVIPVVTPEQAAAEIRTHAGRSAVLFGAERSGLETEEAAVAQKIVTVPINPEFRSLNLAQAVILIAYEWSKHAALAVPTEGDPAEPRATQEQLEGLIGQMDEALDKSGYYFPPDRVPATRKTMRTILSKAGWSNREIQALRGMIRSLTNPRQR